MKLAHQFHIHGIVIDCLVTGKDITIACRDEEMAKEVMDEVRKFSDKLKELGLVIDTEVLDAKQKKE